MDVLYLNVDCLKNQNLFKEKLQEMSSNRKEKILSYKFDADKRLSLGAGILLDEGLKKIGYREKELNYSVNKQGKPYYKELPKFYFNLSHSGHYAAAVFGDMPVGIDLEEKQFDKIRLSIAKRFFHEKEYSLLKNIEDKREQMEVFYRIWTQKESFVKAAGEGMRISFDSFSTIPKKINLPEDEKTKVINNRECISSMKEEFSVQTEQMGCVYFKHYNEIEGYCLTICSKKDEKVRWTEIRM
ncbi:MAG: 4'-phosphopantetheinyl transferase family protein [Lachnospiraceae bacterium]